MRLAFKKLAEQNTKIIEECLGEFIDGTWALARKSSDIIDLYYVRLKNEKKNELLLYFCVMQFQICIVA